MHPQTNFVSDDENSQLYNLLKITCKKFKNKVIIRYHPKSKNKFDLPNIIEHDL